tara:strand:+ start:848 stop:1417 length:570 start_codon:yes stop_codon:yes gene_type:complete
MTIHHTHTRKTLVDLISIYKLDSQCPLVGYKKQKKDILCDNLWQVLQDDKLCLEAGNDYDIFNSVKDFRDNLSSASEIEPISESENIKISITVKKLVNYCKSCSYELTYSLYQSIEEVINDCTYISKFGNIPTVRRAVKLVNLDNKIKNKIRPVISHKVKRNMILKEKAVKDLYPHFSIKRGSFTLDFS